MPVQKKNVDTKKSMKNQRKHKTFPSLTRNLIKTILPENPIIVEAGAHRGRDTLKMHALWPHGIIHAFEPVQNLFSDLQSRIAGKQNIRCYNYALSNKTEQTVMYVSNACCDAVSSLLKPKEMGLQSTDIIFSKQLVHAIILDDWAKKYNVSYVDFLWFDMQGGELTALQASPVILKTVKAIKTEVSFTQRYEDNPLYDQLSMWLKDQGFFEVAHNFHHQLWGDVLFAR